jgi:ABC-2 type transport system permease protein
MRAAVDPGIVSASIPRPARTRTGPGRWIRSLKLMLRFDFARARQWAGLMVVVQVMMGAGMAIMYGFFYPAVTPAVGLYIATGTPTLALIPLGLVMIPAAVGEQKLQGTFDFTWSLPAPRSAQATSTFLLNTTLAIPGAVLALVVATWRYGVHLTITPLLVPAVVLSALMAVSVGFGMALAISNPMITNLITNALVFVVLLFSPIVFPAENLPHWLFQAHLLMPFYNMAQVIRAGLTDGVVSDVAASFGVLAVWTLVGWGLTAWVVGRRR